jgi:tRNA-dihydrouridine synthase
MIGRGIFENLWIFNKNVDQSKIPYQKRLQLLIEHVTLFDKIWGRSKNFSIMKKFYRIYISGTSGSKDVRMQLMKFKTADETLKFLKSL